MKSWQDLALMGKEKSSCTTRVTLKAWVRHFYDGPFCFYEEFAQPDIPFEQYKEVDIVGTTAIYMLQLKGGIQGSFHTLHIWLLIWLIR